MIRQPARATLLSVALLAPLGATAEQTREPTPWYQVELFVFAQRDDNLMAEFWDERIVAPDTFTGAISLLEEGQTPDDLAPPSTESFSTTASAVPSVDPSRYQDDAFRRLAAEQLQLPTTSRFNNRGYRTLFHAAWRQPVGERDEAQPVVIQSEERLADGQPALIGTVSLSLSRYLHLDTDLFLRITPPVGWVSMRPKGEEEPLPLEMSATSGATDSLPSPFGAATAPSYTLQPQLLSPEPQVLTLRLNQSRRMRSEELHYLDHPMLGVLARITPFELPTPDPEPLLPAATPSPGEASNPSNRPGTPPNQ